MLNPFYHAVSKFNSIMKAELLLNDDHVNDDNAEDVKSTPTKSPWRYYILGTYSMLAAMQGLTWSVPGTISPTYQAVYNMDQDTVQLLLNYGPIFYIVCMIPVMYLIDRYGIRSATLSGIALVLVSCVMRCFANDSSILSAVIVHISFILNAAAGPAAMAVPSKLAEDWFPPNERTTATAISALANQTGVLFLYLCVPILCPDATMMDNLKLNILLAAFSVLNALLAAFYFPSHPPNAPSLSARVSKGKEAGITWVGLYTVWKELAKNRAFMVITLVYSIFVGISNCTSALLTANLQAVGASQATAGWVGFSANAAAMGIGVGLAMLSDYFKSAKGAIKMVLVSSLLGSGASYTVYALVLGGYFGDSFSLWTAAISYAIAASFLGAAIPIMFDLSAELTFPHPEGSMLMLLTGSMNLISMFVLFAPSSSFFLWANPSTASIGIFSALCVFFLVPTRVPRFEFDVGGGEEEEKSSFLIDDLQ